jgi:hypothetical protein
MRSENDANDQKYNHKKFGFHWVMIEFVEFGEFVEFDEFVAFRTDYI